MKLNRLICVLVMFGVVAPQAWSNPTAAPALRIGQAQPLPRTSGAIRLATYNVENLFDTKDDPALSGDNEDLDDAKPEAQRAAVAAAIRRIDADVIALQEVESFDALIEFRDQHLKDLGYEHVISIEAGGDERGIENAVISRFPLKDPKIWPKVPLQGEHPAMLGTRENEWAGNPLTFHRSPLRVTVQVPASAGAGEAGYELVLFVVHNKSGRAFNYWRVAEVTKTIELIGELKKEQPKANIAVLGDFNAEHLEEPLELYKAAGFRIMYSALPDGDSRAISHASERTIDMILVNEALQPEIVTGSLFALGTPQLRREEDWRTAPKPAGYASDHIPVVIDLKPKD